MTIFEIAATIFVAAWQFLNCLKKFYLPILFMQKAVQWYFFFPKNIEILRFLQEKAGLQGNKRKRKKPEKALCWPFSTFQLGRKCILNLFNPIFSRLTCGLLNQTCLSCRDDIGYISYHGSRLVNDQQSTSYYQGMTNRPIFDFWSRDYDRWLFFGNHERWS